WGMWFDVGEVVTTSGWDLKVYHLKTNGNLSLLGQLPNIGLRFPGVQVVYPYGGTLGAGGFGAYGSFSPNDTLTLRVEVIDAQGSNVATDSTPTSNSQGFWTAAFSNLPPGGPYQVRAVGNSTASAPSGQFYLA
ncbi:MAG TPA: hypothetical protein VD866_00835, partial [Urbifossiella sp.]|nr:hypothetical protein [Urbifossiella sp.]